MKSQTADNYCSFTNVYVVKAYYFQAYNAWVREFEVQLVWKKKMYKTRVEKTMEKK